MRVASSLIIYTIGFVHDSFENEKFKTAQTFLMRVVFRSSHKFSINQTSYRCFAAGFPLPVNPRCRNLRPSL